VCDTVQSHVEDEAAALVVGEVAWTVDVGGELGPEDGEGGGANAVVSAGGGRRRVGTGKRARRGAPWRTCLRGKSSSDITGNVVGTGGDLERNGKISSSK
jgi:hypothetical protein